MTPTVAMTAPPASPRKKKDFFFEKKKQKTFAHAPSPPDAEVLQLAPNQTSRSFLVLFSKRTLTFFCVTRASSGEYQPRFSSSRRK
jgi:hypothetical protein